MQLATAPYSPRYRVGARNEVILCAGAVGTPQVLLLSGVGPREELEEMNVEVVRESEWVGRNLLDVGISVLFCSILCV